MLRVMPLVWHTVAATCGLSESAGNASRPSALAYRRWAGTLLDRAPAPPADARALYAYIPKRWVCSLISSSRHDRVGGKRRAPRREAGRRARQNPSAHLTDLETARHLGHGFQHFAWSDRCRLSAGRVDLAGYQMTGYTDEEESHGAGDATPLTLESELRPEGATFAAGAPWGEFAVAYRNLITGQTPGSAARHFVAALDAQSPRLDRRAVRRLPPDCRGSALLPGYLHSGESSHRGAEASLHRLGVVCWRHRFRPDRCRISLVSLLEK